MADIEFQVAKRRKEPVTFTLGGDMLLTAATGEDEEVRGEDDHLYVFTPPKAAVMLMPILDRGADDSGMALTKSTFDWLGTGLNEFENDRIKARLKDPADDLDVDMLGKIVEGLSEKVSARPST